MAGDRARDRTRIRIRYQATMRFRNGADTLDAPPETPACVGPLPRSGDLGDSEEADGDQLVEEEGDGREPALEDAEEGTEPTHPSGALDLAELLGARPPVVLLRLTCTGDDVAATPCAVPVHPDAAEMLGLLRGFVEGCFREGRNRLNDADWAQLIGTAPASLTRRLTLLCQIALAGSETVRLGERTSFVPHDIGLERFANKFLALPDGTPVSLRLLLHDRRGRQARAAHAFDLLPPSIKLLALRRALAQERRTGTAAPDYEFAAGLQEALEALLGMPVPRPTETHVQRLRSDLLKRNGLGHLFQKAKDRQQDYDQSQAGSPGESPA
jgi:hypothetical protein